MDLTIDQVTEMAPDASSASAGKKLMARRFWSDLGHGSAALWGKCQGSAVYQVRVDLSNMGYSCSCPSRKFPCKHVLGLLMLRSASPDAVPASDPPEWVDEWLAKRQAREEKKAEKAAQDASKPKKPVDEKARARRIAQREQRVSAGLDRLDLWIKDLVRNGLAGLETKGPSFWDEQAKRLVDAQAPGLASRVGRLANIPGSSREWPEQLLGELGRIKLALHAFGRLNELDPPLQHELRQVIGWNVSKDELQAEGTHLEDEWTLYGQWIDEDDRVRAQRTWGVGKKSGRTVLVLQFSPGIQPFAESIIAGTTQQAVMTLYPGASGQRGKLGERKGELAAINKRIPGHGNIESYLTEVAQWMGVQPWLSAFGCVLHDVYLLPAEDTADPASRWLLRDQAGRVLPLIRGEHWKLLAMSGGQPFDLTGEFNSGEIRPLGAWIDGLFRSL